MNRYSYFAQPIENISTKRIILYELLLREWNETTQKWVIPTQFDLPAATLVHLLQDAIEKLDNHHVSINLTNKQFANLDIMHAITDFVRAHMVPRQLTVELIDNPDFDVLKRISTEYRAAGVMLAIDDVGSDNMYEDVKKLLPYVNTIKFALQNVRAAEKKANKSDIEALNFWFNQAEEQQMLFTFEGIETKDDFDLATRFGITRGQGYFFSRPLEPEVFHNNVSSVI